MGGSPRSGGCCIYNESSTGVTMSIRAILTVFISQVLLIATPAALAVPFSFNTGNPDGLIATGSRPSSAGKIEIETGDDFVLTNSTRITQATFTGLLTGGATAANLGNVRAEIYRVFPKDSADPPSGNVPTRVNSPSDVAFQERDVASSNLSFTVSILNNDFSAANSILNGINKSPNQTTGGEGAVRGTEVLITVTLLTPFDLPADHYFFIPQVEVTNGEFLWLSAAKPIASPGTPFAPDLQSWIRNENLAPDWLRIGTDITQQGPFNAAFSLDGTTSSIPEPAGLLLCLIGLIAMMGSNPRRLSKTSTAMRSRSEVFPANSATMSTVIN